MSNNQPKLKLLGPSGPYFLPQTGPESALLAEYPELASAYAKIAQEDMGHADALAKLAAG